MIEKPDIDDERIIESLNGTYSIQVSQIEFLPIGNDSSAFAYRIQANDGNSYFLKLKKELSNPAGLFVPRFLKDTGIEQVIAPLPTKAHTLWGNVNEFVLILYPFIAGNEAMEAGLTDAQWAEFGAILKRIHTTKLRANTLQYVLQETFVPKWGGFSKRLHEQVNTRSYDDPYQRQLALFWKGNNEIIRLLVERTEMIAKRLQQVDLDFVLCHADIHTANILVTREQDMFIVDWDDTLLAPKERDLMFILNSGGIPAKNEQLFFKGYGHAEINPLALAYYRYEWCVQEIGDFGERVFLAKDAGERTKREAVEGFMKLFSRDDVVEAALGTAVDIIME